MTLLSPVALYLRHGEAVDADRRQRVTYLIELKGLMIAVTIFICLSCVVELKDGRRPPRKQNAARGDRTRRKRHLGRRFQMACTRRNTRKTGRGGYSAGRRKSLARGP